MDSKIWEEEEEEEKQEFYRVTISFSSTDDGHLYWKYSLETAK